MNLLLKISEKSRPGERNRLIREIEHYKMWKGTESRTFLLYTGPVVLKNLVRPEVYYNFMLLSCEIRMCNVHYPNRLKNENCLNEMKQQIAPVNQKWPTYEIVKILAKNIGKF